MTAFDYPHPTPDDNRVGLHYRLFWLIWLTSPFAIQSLARAKFLQPGLNPRSRVRAGVILKIFCSLSWLSSPPFFPLGSSGVSFSGLSSCLALCSWYSLLMIEFDKLRGTAHARLSLLPPQLLTPLHYLRSGVTH